MKPINKKIKQSRYLKYKFHIPLVIQLSYDAMLWKITRWFRRALDTLSFWKRNQINHIKINSKIPLLVSFKKTFKWNLLINICPHSRNLSTYTFIIIQMKSLWLLKHTFIKSLQVLYWAIIKEQTLERCIDYYLWM